MLQLKPLNQPDAEKEYAFFQHFPPENGFLNPYLGMSKEEFVNTAIPLRLQYAQGIGLPPGCVPDTYYFLWLGDNIVGNFKLRHCLNDFLRNGSGHIGFGILPEYRGQDFATQGLAMAVRELCHMPDFSDDEIYFSCLKSNPASLRVIQKNGGVIHHQDEDSFYLRIPVPR